MSATWDATTLAHRICTVLRDDLLTAAAELGPHTNLLDAGLDSLALTQLLLALQELTGVWVEAQHLTPEVLETPSTLAACVHGLLVDAGA